MFVQIILFIICFTVKKTQGREAAFLEILAKAGLVPIS